MSGFEEISNQDTIKDEDMENIVFEIESMHEREKIEPEIENLEQEIKRRDEEIKKLREKDIPRGTFGKELENLGRMNRHCQIEMEIIIEKVRKEVEENPDCRTIIESETEKVKSFMQMPENELGKIKEECSAEQIEHLEQKLLNLKRQKELVDLAEEFKK